MAANFHQAFIFNVPMDTVLNIVRDIRFANTLDFELKSENPTPSCVWFRFHHGTSFTSWGEKITITLTPISNFQTNVDVHSECGMPTQVIDWGKNEENASKIFEYIDVNSRPMPPQHNYAPPRLYFCSNCGCQLMPDAIFCNNCGSKQK